MAGLASLASQAGIGGVGEKRTNAVLIEVDASGSPVTGPSGAATFDSVISNIDGEELPGPLAFQYFPETLTDDKQVNYQRKDIPGASLPLYQWVSSGERSISFQAMFTTDSNLLDPAGSTLRQDLIGRHKTTGVGSRNVDIRSAIAWLRRLMLPAYINGGSEEHVPMAKAPPRVLLQLLNSGIGLAGGGGRILGGPDSILCFMSQCNITYQAFFANGLPRIAMVALAFIEVAQAGGRISFPRRDESMMDALTGNDVFAGYNIKPQSFGGTSG